MASAYSELLLRLLIKEGRHAHPLAFSLADEIACNGVVFVSSHVPDMRGHLAFAKSDSAES